MTRCSPPTTRISELDSLRGLAALAVVLFHYTTRYDQLFGHASELAVSCPWGAYGVDLFFMLSGFVIFMTLDRSKSVGDFAIGRFARLYPAYWVAMGVTFAVVSLAGLPGQEVSLRDAILNLSMVPELVNARRIDGAYWSLQAELLFYAGMVVLWRVGAFRRVAGTLSLWLLASFLVQTAIASGMFESSAVLGLLRKLSTVGSLAYIRHFAVGIVLYQVRKQVGWSAKWIAILAACFLMEAQAVSWMAAIVGGMLGLTLYAAIAGRLAWLAAKPLVYLGALSYSLYLIHQNVGYVMIRQFSRWGWNSHCSIATSIALVLLLAAGLHAWVEKPASSWMKSRLRSLGAAWFGWGAAAGASC